jgi:putative Mn2+ efflux pump MntP
MVLVVIGIGLAVYLYGLAVCKGALFANMDKKQIIFTLGFSVVWQALVLAAGSLVAAELHSKQITKSEYPINAFACLMIFGIIAIRMFIHAAKNKPVVEKRMEKKEVYFSVMGLCIAMGFYSFLTGLAFGLLQTNIWKELLVLVGLFTAGLLGGLYAGYRFGYAQKNGAYICGGVLLFLGDILLFFQYFV